MRLLASFLGSFPGASPVWRLRPAVHRRLHHVGPPSADLHAGWCGGWAVRPARLPDLAAIPHTITSIEHSAILSEHYFSTFVSGLEDYLVTLAVI